MNNSTAIPELMTRVQVARFLGVTPEYIRQLSVSGRIPVAARVGNAGERLYLRHEIEAVAVARASRSAA